MVDRDAVRVSIFFLSNLPNSMDNELFKVPFLYSPQIIPAMGIITNFARFFFFQFEYFFICPKHFVRASEIPNLLGFYGLVNWTAG